MKTIERTYEISYIIGSINPEVKKIKVSTTNQLNDEFIRYEIERQNPHHIKYLTNILSCILLNEKVLAEDKDSLIDKLQEEMPAFNWNN